MKFENAYKWTDINGHIHHSSFESRDHSKNCYTFNTLFPIYRYSGSQTPFVFVNMALCFITVWISWFRKYDTNFHCTILFRTFWISNRWFLKSVGFWNFVSELFRMNIKWKFPIEKCTTKRKSWSLEIFLPEILNWHHRILFSLVHQDLGQRNWHFYSKSRGIHDRPLISQK